jgi:hypothetical protein
MDDPQPNENSTPEETSIEGSIPDYATRKIEPDELFAALEKDAPPPSDAATEILTQSEDAAAAMSVPEIVNAVSPAKSEMQTPVPPAASAQPKPTPPAASGKDNRVSMAVIIAITVVALVCICSCTLLMIAALITIPNM